MPSQWRIAFVVLGFVAAFRLPAAFATPLQPRGGLVVEIGTADGLFNGTANVARAVVMFSPPDVDPLDDTDVTSSPNMIYGRNVYYFDAGGAVTLSGGSGDFVRTEVWGWPNASLDAVPAGTYNVQAFLETYETVVRSDGSKVNVRFPCGDGQPNIDAPGSLMTPVTQVNVSGKAQTIRLTFEEVSPPPDFKGHEIGGCAQGNYEDTALLKHVKIRSAKVSDFWKRDMYVGANVLLPYSYNASNTARRYPVVYSQGHWPGGNGALGYSRQSWAQAWNNGIIPGTNGDANRTTPDLILVTFRHESPFYDDSYAVNSANVGPYGDAINDELIPYIDEMFNTIAEPYARIQEGGSTGGWISAASVIFRPDLFGYCFSSYPDSLDFHRHQDIHLYDEDSAYQHADGSPVPSIRNMENGTEVVLTTTAQENHWELTFGTSSRSDLQWDVWNAVFGAQGYNNYPLEPWNKVTGVIDHDAVEYWKDMDLSHHITSNWDNSLNLGEVLRGRIFIYVGSADTYYLNEGVAAFQQNVASKGGDDWTNVTIFEGKPHGGTYQLREIWNYLEFLETWIEDHSPTGNTPLLPNVITPAARGNKWDDVLARKGRQAAIARQAKPAISLTGTTVRGTVGRWDSGVSLEAQWLVDGKAYGSPSAVKQGDEVALPTRAGSQGTRVELAVTGRKSGYLKEARKSDCITL